MKALSMTQPWATLKARGLKRLETRSWSTRHRGPTAIHAAKGFPRDARQLCSTAPFREALADTFWRDLPTGAIIGTVHVVDVYPIITFGDVRYALARHAGAVCVEDGFATIWTSVAGTEGLLGTRFGPHEASFGDFTPGRYAWLTADHHELPEPVAARGRLGLWDWEPGL